MSPFGNLFRKSKEPVHPAPVTPAPPAGASKDPELIRVFDNFGREVQITRQEWRERVLPANLHKAWNQPDALYSMIVAALRDGFRSEVIDAAKHLSETDPSQTRGACLWGVVLRENGRLDEAEKVFRDYTEKHGEDALILTNLSRVYTNQKNQAKAGEILWRALEIDPNQETAVGWYEAAERERGGDAAGSQALRRIAARPGSWRAQLWLARAALRSRQLAPALEFYGEILARCGRPVPAGVLMQISGDLGNAGHIPELVNLVGPHFNATMHGIEAGNNLIKANLDLGQIDAARQILDQLYALNRPDWAQTLSYWDTEIAKARLDPAPTGKAAPLQMAMLTIQGPVWLKPDSPAAELFPAQPGNGVLISFLGGSAELASNSQRIEHQLSDAPGRLSRALPLFLAEQIAFASAAGVQTLVPWIVSGGSGFVLSGGRWSDQDASQYARQSGAASDYAVVVHLRMQAEPWIADLRLVRTIDAHCLAELSADFVPARFGEALPELARRLLAALASHAGVVVLPSPVSYRLPEAGFFPDYLLRLEQLLAVRCAGMDEVPAGFLNGEREIIDGNIRLCLNCPASVSVRIVLAQTLLTMRRIRPRVVAEFREKVGLLQKQDPLGEPAQSVVQRLLDEALK